MSLERTILPETAEVGGVDVRVVEDRERKSGNRVEVTRSLYAIDKVTGDVYSLGERVDNLRDGTLVSHQGSWQAGAGGASCGLAMPADPRVGDRYISEHAPAAALVERIEVVGRGETVVTPAGRFRNCLHLRETSSDEPSRGSDAWFAPGVGMVKDDEVELVRASVPPSS